MFTLKPDFEQVLDRFEAWWHGEILDRPPTAIQLPKPHAEHVHPPPRRHATHRDRWLDTEYRTVCIDAHLRNTLFLGDALPIAWPNLGPEIFSAFFGCDMDYRAETAWSVPLLDDWSPESLARIRFSEDNFYFRKVMEMMDAFIERGRGRFLVGYTDLHPGGDAIAAFRDPQRLLIDTIERPDEVRRLCDRITDDFLHIFDMFHEKLSAAGMPSTCWVPCVCRGRFHVPSNDFSCMISEAAFASLFLPGIVRECRHMDKCIYHLDGPRALRFLDLLLEIDEIQAIQWVPGAGHDDWADWIEVYQRIQAGGKALQLWLPAEDLDCLMEALAPEGVFISSISGITTEDEARAVLRKLATWTRKR